MIANIFHDDSLSGVTETGRPAGTPPGTPPSGHAGGHAGGVAFLLVQLGIHLARVFGDRLKPLSGDCCVFCSYGSVPCPPVQSNLRCCVPKVHSMP